MTALDVEVARIASRQHGAFHLQQVTTGLGTRSACRRRVEAGRWRRVVHDVFIVEGAPDTWHQRLWVGLLESGKGALVSRRSAASILELPGFGAGPLDALQPEFRDEHRLTCETHISSWIPAQHRTVVAGMPVTSMARTLFDLAGTASSIRRRRGLPYVHPQRVERALDDALVRRLVTLDQLAEAVATLGRRGRPGTRLMRALLEERGTGFVATESTLEDLFLAVIEAAGLPAPTRQRVLGDRDAAGRVDFVYLDARVVVECDSRKHHFGTVDAERDRWRDLELSAGGWVVVRVTWWQLVNQPERFTRELRNLLDRRHPADSPAN